MVGGERTLQASTVYMPFQGSMVPFPECLTALHLYSLAKNPEPPNKMSAAVDENCFSGGQFLNNRILSKESKTFIFQKAFTQKIIFVSERSTL